MASWRPQTELEQEIISLQPDYNFIYGDLSETQKNSDNGYHSRPPAHLEFLNKKSREKSNTEDAELYANGLNAIREVHKMVGLKQLGEPVNIEDLDNFDYLDRETIAMIRYCGMGPTLDLPLNEKTTIPTLPVNKDIRLVQKGNQKFPVIFNDEYFKVESTRMRNAKLLENINSITNGIESTQMQDERGFDDISVLNEEETREPTEAEVPAKEYQEYLIAYPALGNNNDRSTKSSTKTKQMSLQSNLSTKKGSQKERSLNTSSSSSNSSSRIYNSFDNSNSSKYFSANESFTEDHINNYDETNMREIRFHNLVSQRRKSYYTPKEVYEMKRKI